MLIVLSALGVNVASGELAIPLVLSVLLTWGAVRLDRRRRLGRGKAATRGEG